MTKKSVRSHYRKVACLKGGIQRRNYFFEELEKLREEIKEQEEIKE